MFSSQSSQNDYYAPSQEIKGYYIIKADQNLTSYNFYNSFLPQLHSFFAINSNKKILIDFSDLCKISPLVIPNLLSIGNILKNHFGEPVDLFIPWNIKLLAYLRDINFLNLVDQHYLFKLDERFIGGIPIERSISDICYTFMINKNTSKEDIYLKYLADYGNVLHKRFNSENIAIKLLGIMAEICHNGCNHSESKCFVSFQINQNRKFEFSVSDSGIGYYNSFQKKAKSNFFFYEYASQRSLNNNLAAILEAVFYRKNTNSLYPVYGIYSMFNDVLPFNGVIRIHSGNSQIIFTKKNFEHFFNIKLNSESARNIIESFINKSNSSEEIYSPIRVSDTKFRGVHIEIEIPFN